MTKADDIFKHLSFDEIQQFDTLKNALVVSLVQATIADVENSNETIDEEAIMNFAYFVKAMLAKYKSKS